MKSFQSEISYHNFLWAADHTPWQFERNWIGVNQSPEDSEFMNWLADYIYPVIDNYSANWEAADMYPYDYQY